jgi:hypothetical protein
MRSAILCSTLCVFLCFLLAGCPKASGSSDDPKTYSVTYYANGATGGRAPTDSGEYEKGDKVVVKGTGTLAKTGYGAIGWNSAAGGSGTSYLPGKSFAMKGADAKLYARWGSWKTLGAAGFSSGGIAYEPTIAIDPSGVPYVAYTDYDSSYNASVMKYDGSSWVQVGSPCFSAGEASGLSLAFDSSGTPYLAYMDVNEGCKASVMKYDGSGSTGWVHVGSAGFSPDRASSPSLAIDSRGVPYVAYTDYDKEYKASVMKYDGTGGTGWVQVGSAGFSPRQADSPSLAFDLKGILYLAYTDSSEGGPVSSVIVMKYTGAGSTGWDQVGSASISEGAGGSIDLAFDPSGVPYVAYIDQSNLISVMKYEGSSWVQVGAAKFVKEISGYSFAIDPSGVPYVSSSNTSTLQASVMKYDGSSWVQVGAAGFSSGQADTTFIAIDSSGIPYVAYRDFGGSAGGKVTVMRLAP